MTYIFTEILIAKLALKDFLCIPKISIKQNISNKKRKDIEFPLYIA